MAKLEKSAHKSKHEKSLQKNAKLEPTYKSAEFINDSSSASEAPAPSKRRIPLGGTSKTVSIPSTKANLQNGSATKKEKHKDRKKSSDTQPVHLSGDRVEHEEAMQEGASKEKARVNGLGSPTEDSGGSGKKWSPQPELSNKHSKPLVKNAVSSSDIPQAKGPAAGSSTSSGSEEHDIDVPPATTLKGKEDAVESNAEDDEVENRGGATGDEADSDAPSEGEISEEASESEKSASSDVEQSESNAPPTRSAHSQRPIPTYQVPPDFEPAAISLGDAPGAERLFSTARLEGKELWHIVLPSSVPVSALKEFPPQGILDGSKFLSHDDSDYSLVMHREAVARSLLIPSHTNDLFTPVKTAFAKSLRLQQLVKVPSHGVNPELRALSSEVPKKKRNQQPEGLRMRYQPFGIPDSSIVEPGADFDPSEEHLNAKQRKMEASQFKPPPDPLVDDSTRKKEKKKKRKHGEIASSAPVTPSSIQMKKARQDHPDLGLTSPPMQSPTLVSTRISGLGNSQPVMQAKSEDLITITNPSSMQVEQETFSSPANASPTQTHRHKLQSSPSVTPARPEHDVSSFSNKSTNKKSHPKASKSKIHRNKLLQPFQVPRSVSPAQTSTNGAYTNGATRTAPGDTVTPHLDTPATNLGADRTITDGLDDRQATAGVSPHDLSQQSKKRKKTHKSDDGSLPLTSFPETATPTSGDVKVRDFVKASDLGVTEDVNTAAASELFSNSKIVETPSFGTDSRKGVGELASKSHAGSRPTTADTRIRERDVDASSPAAVDPSKDVFMQEIASKSTDTPLDVAAEREEKKQTKKALKEARKKSTGKLKSDPLRSNGIGRVADRVASSPSLAGAKDAVVGEESMMKSDSQPFEETDRARKKRERRERKKSNIVAEEEPVQTASPKFEPVSTTMNHDTPSNGPSKTNSQLYEESERARKKLEKKIKKEKDAAQFNSGGMSANTSTSAPVFPPKDPIANDDTPAPTNSQLYYEGERARKKREEELRGETSKHETKPVLTTTRRESAPLKEVLPPPTNDLAGNDDIAAARAKRKQDKQARKEERRRLKAITAAAADAAAGK